MGYFVHKMQWRHSLNNSGRILIKFGLMPGQYQLKKGEYFEVDFEDKKSVFFLFLRDELRVLFCPVRGLENFPRNHFKKRIESRCH